MKEIQEKYPKSPIFVGRLLKENLKENVKNTKEYFMQATDLVWDTPFSYDTENYVNFGTLNNDEKKKYSKMLSCIVSGDIFVKESSLSPGSKDGHIAMVLAIPDDINSYTDATELAEKIILIEGQFANYIQSVINILTLDDYNRSLVSNAKQLYNDVYSIPKGLQLYCKSWALRRLK